MTEKRTPARCFAPGEFIAEEIAYRKMTVQTLAWKCSCPVGDIESVLDGTMPFTPAWACKLSHALGWSADFLADFLMGLEEGYQAYRRSRDPSCPKP